MGKLVPIRLPRRASRWTKAETYLPGGKQLRRGKRRAGGAGWWFPALLVILPLSAFTAVLLLPPSGGPDEAAASIARLDQAPRSAAELDAEQPDVTALALQQGGGAGTPPGAADREQARFGLCSGSVRVTCVVDGDTIWYRGEKIRIADLDTPEVSKPACAAEAAMGRRATLRLQALLNAGPFTLEPNPSGDSVDRYGRSLMVVTRGGESLGEVLVREGLAEQWGGPRKAWC
jgi:endonuclease YncB( thermonuclease family)